MAPSPSPPRPGRWHAECAHPGLHRLWVALVLGGWVYGACRYGLPWVIAQSQAVSPGWRPLVAVLLVAVWTFLVLPWVAGGLYACTLGRCQPLPTPPGPGRSGHRTVERVIVSPEAAAQHFGIRGTIILERERED